MADGVEVIGVYSVPEAAEPVHLIEVVVASESGDYEIADFTHELAGQPRANWQVPYDEKILDDDGTQVVADGWDERDNPDAWAGRKRLAFFFHYLDLGRPLLTPYGPVDLPAPQARPDRLAILEYEEP